MMIIAIVNSGSELALASFLKARERLEETKAGAIVASEKYHDLLLQDDDEIDPRNWEQESVRAYDLEQAERVMHRLWAHYVNELRKYALEESYARKIGVLE